MALYVTLPAKLYYGPPWLLPAVEGALFVALLVARQIEEEGYEWQRGMAIGLIAASLSLPPNDQSRRRTTGLDPVLP